MPIEEKRKIIREQTLELKSFSTFLTADNPIVHGVYSSRIKNPSESRTIVESSFGPSHTNQPIQVSVPTPGPSSSIDEIPDPIGQSYNTPGRSKRVEILKQNILEQLSKVARREEQAVPSVPEEIELHTVPENVTSSGLSRGYPSFSFAGPTHNEEIINTENEPPTEENRNNIRRLIQHGRDQMRNCFSQNCYIQMIIILSTLVGLTSLIIFTISVLRPSTYSQDNYIIPRAPVGRPFILPEYEKYRLPRSVKPTHYNLKILPILSDEHDEHKFIGEVLIEVNILETCQNITLHSHHLTIESIRVGNNETNLEYLFSYVILTNKQFLIIYPYKTLTKMDKFVLKIRFNGYFNKNLVGLYRSSYNYDGEVRSAILTQMEPIHARKVFPCFDEPGLQATFQITIGHKAHMKALSNVPGSRTSKIFLDAGDEYVFTEFEKTPVMSTYLVAFAVVDYKFVKQHNIEIYSERSQNETNMLELAEKSNEMIEYFNKLFDYKYEHPKTTFITSNDFHNWGMEHWGLITLRTDVVYPNNESAIYHQEIKNVLIANEIAHQWFGNLITPEWWSHLWLQEGYSTYMSYVAIDKLYPQEDTFIEFNKLKQDTFRKDSMENTRAIAKEAYTPNDIANNIHFVVYQKAASIIMMLNNVLTTENHISGLRRLLIEKSYQTITPNDLYENLALESDIRLEDLKSVMDSWINQIGFPLVTVSRDPHNFVVIKQEKFNFTKVENSTDDTLWYIPLTYVVEGDEPNKKNKILWMNPIRSTSFDLPITRLKKNNWIIFNSDQLGFYRVNYEPNEWSKIIRYLRKENGLHDIAPINRALLIDDSLALARAGYINYTIPFELLTYLEEENEYFPWTRAISSLKYVDIMLMKSKDYYKFKGFMQAIVRKIFQNISLIVPKSSRYLKLQTEIYEWACRVDLPECASQSIFYMNSWIRSTEESEYQVINPIPLNLRSTVYCTAVRHGSDSMWYVLWVAFQYEKSVMEKEKILYGLSCSKETNTLRDHLINTLRGQLSDHKNFHKILHDVSQHAIGFNTVINVLVNYVDHILPVTGKIEDLLKHSQITSKCNTEFDLAMVEKMTSGYDLTAPDLKPFIDEIHINILWMKNNHRNIVNWLEARYSSYF